MREWGTPSVGIWTGASALAVSVLTVLEFLIRQLTVGSRPPLNEDAALVVFTQQTAAGTLSVILTDTFLMASLAVFLAGFRHIVVLSRPDLTWIADLGFGSGLVFISVTLVGDGLEAGGALDASDASVIRALTAGHALLFGPIGCILTALVAGASGYLILASGSLPRWTGWFALGVAAANIGVTPTIFGGTDDQSFHSVGGWGTALIATFPWLVWVGCVGIVVIRGRRAHRERAREARVAAA